MKLKTGSTIRIASTFKELQGRTQHFYNELVRARDTVKRKYPEPKDDALWDTWDEKYENAYEKIVAPVEIAFKNSSDALLREAVKKFSNKKDLVLLFETALGLHAKRKALKVRNKALDMLLRMKTATTAADRRHGPSLKETGHKGRKVTIYRGVLASEKNFHDMDYVTLSYKWAKGHAEHVTWVEEDVAHVISAKVSTEHVYEASNNGEYFYKGPTIPGRSIFTARGGVTV